MKTSDQFYTLATNVNVKCAVSSPTDTARQGVSYFQSLLYDELHTENTVRNQVPNFQLLKRKPPSFSHLQ